MRLRKLVNNKTVRNAGWIIGGRLVNKLLSFVVGVLTARFLGPGNYGLIGYVGAYITFFASLCNLGINSVIIKDFVDHPQEEGTAIGTTIMLRAISSLLSAMMIVGIVSLAEHGDSTVIWVAVLSSFGLLFQVVDTIKRWFQARLQSKYAAVATVLSYVIVSAYKIGLMITGKNVLWFAMATSVEYLVVAAVLLIAYKRNQGPTFSFSFRKAKELLNASRGYILSDLMISIYAATDRLMLKQMLDDESVGFYTTAVSVCNAWTFLLQAAIDSIYPSIIRAYSVNKYAFEKKNRQLYAVVIYTSLIVSMGICVVARPLVQILYGAEYLPAVFPLQIIVWYTAFSYLGGARNAWIVSGGWQKYLKYLYFGSAVINVVLNSMLIPIWGVSGAAAASLMTQIATIVIFPLLIRPLRPNAKLMWDAFRLKDIWP